MSLAFTTLVGSLVAALVGCSMAWWTTRCRRLRRLRHKMVEALDERRDRHAIITHTLYVEFPFLSAASIDFVLFRSFCFPSMSRILRASAHFRTDHRKRYDDTDLLLREFLLHHVDSPHGSAAVRRMNYLHGLYPSISNADFIYVLCLFILYPMKWAARYGYREWTAKEKEAHFHAWHDIGLRMGIRNIPETITDTAEYVESYEARHMAYSDSNRDVSEASMKVFLDDFPLVLRPLARRLMYALMDDRMRDAMGYPKQPGWLRWAVHGALRVFHGFLTGWFLPPRPLEKALVRIAPLGCPMVGGRDDPGSRVSVSYQRFWAMPCVYADKVYRIEELGTLNPGKLAPLVPLPEGEAMFCPIESCNNEAWPFSFLSRAS